jgi:TIR domain
MDSSYKQYDAFVSHSSKDRTYAELVCQSLESHSLRCWIAPRDIQPGVEWGAAIIDGIDRSKVMLVIFSTNANDSAQVRREVERGIGKSMPILPFRIEDANPKGALEFALSNTHWLDGFKPPIEPTLTQLVQSVKALCAVPSAVPSNNPPPVPSKPNSQATAKTQGMAKTPPAAKPQATTQVKPETKPRSRKSVLVATVIGLLVFASAGVYGVSSWLGGDAEAGEAPAVAKQWSGLTKAGFQRRENKKFLGRWIAVQESTDDGGKLPPKVVSDRAFTVILRTGFTLHRRNPTLTETILIRGEIEFEEGNEFDKFIFTGVDQDKKKQTFVGIYDFDGTVWRWCFRRSDGGGKLQAPINMNTAGERNTYFVALKQVADKDD